MKITPRSFLENKNKIELFFDLINHEDLSFVVNQANLGSYGLAKYVVIDVISVFLKGKSVKVNFCDVVEMEIYLLKYSNDYFSNDFIEKIVLLFKNGIIKKRYIFNVLEKIKMIRSTDDIGIPFEDLFLLMIFDDKSFGE